MNAREMHYDFKQKLNRIDSQQYRNLKVPEIDWKLNEAQELFVKSIAQPRDNNEIGFEFNQRTIDDIRTIVVNQTPVTGIVAIPFDSSSFNIVLPSDYWFFINAKILVTKGSCIDVQLNTKPVQHNDEHELSPFDRSSFEWRVSNITFNSEGIRVFTDGTYTVNKMMIDYIKRPIMIHNAQDYIGGSYVTLDGMTLSGSQSCELPKGVHDEIVDLAVFLTTIDLDHSNTQLKQNRVKIKN